MCLIPRLTCGEGSLSLYGDGRLVVALARSVALARLIVRNRTHNLPRPSVFLPVWRRLVSRSDGDDSSS